MKFQIDFFLDNSTISVSFHEEHVCFNLTKSFQLLGLSKVSTIVDTEGEFHVVSCVLKIFTNDKFPWFTWCPLFWINELLINGLCVIDNRLITNYCHIDTNKNSYKSCCHTETCRHSLKLLTCSELGHKTEGIKFAYEVFK